MSRTLRSHILILAFAAALSPLVGQTSAPQSNPRSGKLSPQVDELFKQWQSTESPGAAVLVTLSGEVVHARGYGMANLEHGIPIRPNTVFDIGSLAKQFSAMAVALLEADGRLSLDDDVRKYVPELPDFGDRITLRHLIHHTSGLRDWPGMLAIGGWNYQDVISSEQILRMAYHQRDLNFKPGDAHLYSNTGYTLLAEVVARISGQSFRQFCDERIFRPLGMRQTHVHDDHTEIVPGRADSYRRVAGGRFQRVASNLTALGSSSLFTTIEDLAKWIGIFEAATPVVGGTSVVKRLHERGTLNSGDRVGYAFGQGHGQYRGLPIVSHTGSWAGFRSELVRFPEQRFAVVILSNAANLDPFAISRKIADLYLTDRMSAARPPVQAAPGGAGQGARGATSWQPTATELAPYVGEYRSAELQTSYAIELRGDDLVARHFRTGERRFTPISVDRFQALTFEEVRFLRRPDGTIEAFTANSGRIRNLRFDRVARVR